MAEKGSVTFENTGKDRPEFHGNPGDTKVINGVPHTADADGIFRRTTPADPKTASPGTVPRARQVVGPVGAKQAQHGGGGLAALELDFISKSPVTGFLGSELGGLFGGGNEDVGLVPPAPEVEIEAPKKEDEKKRRKPPGIRSQTGTSAAPRQGRVLTPRQNR